MKRTGFNTWGSDILFMNPSSSVDCMKCLLMLDISVLYPAHHSAKTEISSPSLHLKGEKIKNDNHASCFQLPTKKETSLFHIIEQDCGESTVYVNKKVAVCRRTAGYGCIHHSILWNCG